jgi:flap endonuclease-1
VCIREVELKSLHGRKIAIDASMTIYQFLIAVRSGGPNQQAAMLTNADGETTSHIQGMFNRTIRFITEGIRPVFVFDGKPPNIKSGELEALAKRHKPLSKSRVKRKTLKSKISSRNDWSERDKRKTKTAESSCASWVFQL